MFQIQGVQKHVTRVGASESILYPARLENLSLERLDVGHMSMHGDEMKVTRKGRITLRVYTQINAPTFLPPIEHEYSGSSC